MELEKPNDNKQEAEHLEPLNEPVIKEELETPTLEPKPDTKTPVPHPLTPGGRRFEQVYAKGKQAEREAEDLRDRLLVAEAKLEMLTKGQQPAEQADTEYSWEQLEAYIAQGRITRADAEAHRESVIRKNVLKEVDARQDSRTQLLTQTQRLDDTITSYVSAKPEILNEQSAERQRLDEEFDWVASTQGLNPAKLTDVQRKGIQAIALRNVYGPLDSFQRKATLKTETHQGIGGGDAPPASKNPDQVILDGLTKTQVEHYRKMMKAGRYKGGWKEVVEEIKFVPPARSR